VNNPLPTIKRIYNSLTYYSFSEGSLKRTTLIAILLIGLTAVGVGGYFVTNTIISNYFSGEANLVSLSHPEEILKGDPLKLIFELDISGINRLTVEAVEIRISSTLYSLNDTIHYDINQELLRGTELITIDVGPLLNTSMGFFALNVGEYKTEFVNFTFEDKAPDVLEELSMIFNVINPQEIEQLSNEKFQDGLSGWNINQVSDNTSVGISTHGSLDGNSLLISNNQDVQPNYSIWVSISQTINMTNSHFLSFEQIIESTNCSINFKLFLDGIEANMSLELNVGSVQNQIIHYGEASGTTNVTLQISFTYADNNTNVYLDDLSILQYEHRVYVLMLNDNWETIVDEIGRSDLFTTIAATSYFFEKELGIKLIPILELEWHPSNLSWIVVDDDALASAGEMLGLESEWNVATGRSNQNHGFDLLTSYSNQTSEHFGFAYYEMNACFHFGQSGELGEYSWLTIVGDWAENLIQHEISHNFGAHDRDRTFFPPSVMSKPTNPDQVVADFLINKLWLQVNNWLTEDVLLMLANRAMFD